MTGIRRGKTDQTLDIHDGKPPCWPHDVDRLNRELPLLAGPWVGEFGWELFGWQAYLRSVAPEFPAVKVACRKGMEYIYEDLADDIIAYEIQAPGTGGWICDGLDEVPDPRGDVEGKHSFLHPYFRVGYNLGYPKDSHPGFFKQEFIPLGEEQKNMSYDIVMHGRDTDKYHSAKRNVWSNSDWVRFANKFSKCNIAAVGSYRDALCPEGVEDRRGVPLRDTTTVIRNSECMVGPSSGPMHLAALCETPIVVFTADPNNKARYNKYWNPFSTPVKYIGMRRWNENVVRRVDRSVKAFVD